MKIRELTPVRDEDVLALTDFMKAVVAVDSPWVLPMEPDQRRVYLEQGWDGEAPLAYVGEIDGEIVACGHLDLPERDNTHLAWAQVAVLPAYRRKGLGTAMFDHLLAVAREAGRTSIGTDGFESEASVGFADKHGLERKSQSIQRRIYPQQLDRERLARQVSESQAAAVDYELLRVEGRTPPELVDEVVRITAAINDAPTDDLDIEDEVYSAERLAAYDEVNVSTGRLYTIYAQHRATGELAGKTVVKVEKKRPAVGHQHDTSVVAEHRGHRLGMLLKASMLQWLAEAEPQVEHIDTWNAESNDHMISVNEELGYVILGRELEFQRDL